MEDRGRSFQEILEIFKTYYSLHILFFKPCNSYLVDFNLINLDKFGNGLENII
jgi:hypothetical protein